jgi:cytochrome P450
MLTLLCSSVPVNSRTAITDTVLPLGGGPDGKSPIFIKSGTQVNYQVWAMHRRKDLYGEDAEEFKPERWEKLRPG